MDEKENTCVGQWDGSFASFIQCPHCGTEDHESTDYPCSLNHDGDETEYQCYHCDAVFTVMLSVTYEYASKPLFIGPKVNAAFRYELRAKMRERGELPPL
jgi:uncharacterized C2H2 Zn-finger protein